MVGFAEKLGVIPVRGSSHKGGRQALDTMAKYLSGNKNRIAATVLDGPQGPRFRAKTGMITLAKISRTPLLPIMMSAWPAITIKTAWDCTLIPLPFSRVTVAFGKPWHVPETHGTEEIRILRGKVEKRLNQMMFDADSDTGYIKKWPVIYGRTSNPHMEKDNPDCTKLSN